MTPRPGVSTRAADNRHDALLHSAFTLVELLLVLVIIGSISVVAAPRFMPAGGFAERSYFDDTQAAIRYAQKLAVATGCSVQISISSDVYSLAQQTSCGSGSYDQSVAHPGTGAADYDGDPPAGVALTSDVNPFSFDALGRTLNGSGSVSSVNLSVGTRSIVVAGETGLVYVP